MAFLCIQLGYLISMILQGYAHQSLSEMEQYLQVKVSTGYYSNASEVVRDAIRRMRDEEREIGGAAVRGGGR